MKSVAGTGVFLILFAVFPLMVAAKLDWIDLATLIDIVMNIAGLSLLIVIIKKPWDLYFEARHIIEDHDEADRRGITTHVDPAQRIEVQKLARRLLLLCLALHFGSGLAIAVGTFFSRGVIGYYYAGFCALSTMFRPLHAYYNYQLERLRALRGELRFPRDDIITLKDRVEVQEQRLTQLEQESRDSLENLGSGLRAGAERIGQLEDKLRQQQAEYDAKVDRICREFERALEQLTQDQELLRGIRAFVRLIKNTA